MSIYVQDVQSKLSPAGVNSLSTRIDCDDAATEETATGNLNQPWEGGEGRGGEEVCIISPSPSVHVCVCARGRVCVRVSVCARVWLINNSPFATPRVGLFSPVDKPRGKRI